MKLNAHIKATAAQLLNYKTFKKVQKKDKTTTFNKHKH